MDPTPARVGLGAVDVDAAETVVVHPLVEGVAHTLGQRPVTGPGRHSQPGDARRGHRRVALVLCRVAGDLVEAGELAGDRRQPAVDALAVDHYEQLLRSRELGEVSRQHHRSDPLLGPGVVDGSDGGVDTGADA